MKSWYNTMINETALVLYVLTLKCTRYWLEDVYLGNKESF